MWKIAFCNVQAVRCLFRLLFFEVIFRHTNTSSTHYIKRGASRQIFSTIYASHCVNKVINNFWICCLHTFKDQAKKKRPTKKCYDTEMWRTRWNENNKHNEARIGASCHHPEHITYFNRINIWSITDTHTKKNWIERIKKRSIFHFFTVQLLLYVS